MIFILLDNVKTIYFVGIGGVSTSSLALILKSKGYNVLGSDIRKCRETEILTQNGIIINFDQKYSNITSDVDLLIYTSAVDYKNEELLAANDLNIKILKRAEILNVIMQDFKNSICVCGTHGKTTTTSILATVLINSQNDPTVLVGGNLDILNGNFKLGSSDFFVAESCEYKNNFHYFFPKSSIILNIDMDHPDFFSDLSDVENSFKTFGNINTKEVLIVNETIEHLFNHSNLITFGFKNANYVAKNITYTKTSTTFDLYKNNSYVISFESNLCGEHNVLNCLSVIALCDYYNISMDCIKNGIKKYYGVHRRLEFKGTYRNIDVYDDYAHHPMEIIATYNSLNLKGYKNICCIFQPHTYSRTKELLNEFSDALSLFNNTIVLDIYAARETDNLGISSIDLVNNLKNEGIYISTYDNVTSHIESNFSKYDCIITVGATDVFKIGEKLISMV